MSNNDFHDSMEMSVEQFTVHESSFHMEEVNTPIDSVTLVPDAANVYEDRETLNPPQNYQSQKTPISTIPIQAVPAQQYYGQNPNILRYRESQSVSSSYNPQAPQRVYQTPNSKTTHGVVIDTPSLKATPENVLTGYQFLVNPNASFFNIVTLLTIVIQIASLALGIPAILIALCGIDLNLSAFRYVSFIFVIIWIVVAGLAVLMYTKSNSSFSIDHIAVISSPILWCSALLLTAILCLQYYIGHNGSTIDRTIPEYAYVNNIMMLFALSIPTSMMLGFSALYAHFRPEQAAPGNVISLGCTDSILEADHLIQGARKLIAETTLIQQSSS